MAQTPPPTVTAAPSPPIRGTTTFKSLVDAFLTWMATAGAQFQALGANVYANCVDAFNSATSASTSASAASTSLAAALVAANSVLWVSGASVTQFSNVISPANGRTYRRISATGSGTLDPSDPTNTANYLLISMGPFAYAKFSDRKAGVGGGASVVGMQRRTLNTTESNSITGMSISGDQITTPAGTYEIDARAPGCSSQHQIYLYNETAGTYLLIGSSSNATSSTNFPTDSFASGRIVLASAQVLSIRHYFATVQATYGLGAAVGSGQSEVYAEISLTKVA
jgi:hypothetical protein